MSTLTKYANDYNKMYDAQSATTKTQLDGYAKTLGYDTFKNNIAQGYSYSKIIKDLIVVSSQQNLFAAEFDFAPLANQKITTIPNGAFQRLYRDDYQGSSYLNNDVYNTTTTGESTTAETGYDDVTINNWNGKLNQTFTEYYQTNQNYSRKVKLLDNMLDNVTYTQAMFMALVKNMNYMFDFSYKIFNFQRFLNFLNVNTYQKTFTYDANFIQAPTDEASAWKAKVNAQKLFTDLKTYLLNTKTPSRTWLTGLLPGQGANIAKQPLIYDGKNKKRVLLIDNSVANFLDANLYAGTFQLEKLDLPDNLTIHRVDFNQMKEWYDFTTGGTIAKQVKGNPYWILMDDDVYLEYRFYKGVKVVDTPNLYQIANIREERGFARNKMSIMAIGGIKLS